MVSTIPVITGLTLKKKRVVLAKGSTVEDMGCTEPLADCACSPDCTSCDHPVCDELRLHITSARGSFFDAYVVDLTLPSNIPLLWDATEYRGILSTNFGNSNSYLFILQCGVADPDIAVTQAPGVCAGYSFYARPEPPGESPQCTPGLPFVVHSVKFLECSCEPFLIRGVYTIASESHLDCAGEMYFEITRAPGCDTYDPDNVHPCCCEEVVPSSMLVNLSNCAICTEPINVTYVPDSEWTWAATGIDCSGANVDVHIYCLKEGDECLGWQMKITCELGEWTSTGYTASCDPFSLSFTFSGINPISACCTTGTVVVDPGVTEPDVQTSCCPETLLPTTLYATIDFWVEGDAPPDPPTVTLTRAIYNAPTGCVTCWLSEDINGWQGNQDVLYCSPDTTNWTFAPGSFYTNSDTPFLGPSYVTSAVCDPLEIVFERTIVEGEGYGEESYGTWRVTITM